MSVASRPNGPSPDFHPDLNLLLQCPECKISPPDLVERFSEGDVVCGNCGLVLGDRVVDTRSEWRTFSNDDQGNDDPSRVGDAGNPLLDDNQLDTLIASGAPGSTLGRDLSRTQNRSAHDRKDTALQDAFSRISQMCEAYSLPKMVQDAAKQAFKLSYEDKKLKGKSTESLMAAAIFLACRHSGVARTFREMCALTSVPKKEIGRTFKIMEKLLLELGIKPSHMSSEEYQPLQTTAEDLMRRFCSHLGLSSQITRAAEHIARRTKEEGTLAGRSPTSIAAAAIYFASGLFGNPQTASKIADRAGVSEGTIKTSYKLLWEARDKLVDPEWIKSGKAKMEDAPKV
ncbi:uncharacterized protein SAPINGB_P006113 [Magnusiomyces paraingens]|uniref:Transcription initiation factor IIB n=1 Tax=Magnusiomyces paraingens TaxID=2606893 RepID=A0A5E8C4H6_9ASCO|nr:uncharacterized protein SAPINGB_P006113 [Saprochaete ingens]VVT58252.1 unnamed protein product [Saprochaete ingens]